MKPVSLAEGEKPSDELIAEFFLTPIQQSNRRQVQKLLELVEAKGPLHGKATYTVYLEEFRILVVFSKEGKLPVHVVMRWFGDIFLQQSVWIGKKCQENLSSAEVESSLVSHFK